MTRAPQGNIKFTHSIRRSQVKKICKEVLSELVQFLRTEII